MEFGPQLAEGKTKIVYAHPTDATRAVLVHKDGISAGDGVRRNLIAGKGALSGRTAANVFALLNRNGIATHFIDAPELTAMQVRRCAMIPVEVVMRRRATGSFLKRNPGITEGTHFDPPLVEYFLKDDARHDPQMRADEMVTLGFVTTAEAEHIAAEGVRVFEVVEQAWATQHVTLVDLKIEFGHDSAGNLIVADMIDNDSWRIWPGGDKAQMLDKQVYRNLGEVGDNDLAQVKRLYETVATMTDEWWEE